MTLNERLTAALAPLGLPVVPDHYTGTAPVYMTFNYDLLPEDFADDEPLFWRFLVQVHLFAPMDQNTLDLRARVPRLLMAADFTAPEVVDAGDETGQHYVFQTEAMQTFEF